MRVRAFFAAVLLVCVAVPLDIQASDLGRVVHAVENDFAVKHEHIPLLGFALFVGKVASGFQMPGVKLAVFEDPKLNQLAPEDLEHSIFAALGPEWIPFVKTISHHGKEQDWILLHDDGKKTHMFIASVEGGELSLIELKISQRQMRRWINDTDEMAKNGKGQ